MIFFVGPLPPPLGGFSYVTQQMLALLLNRGGHEVRTFDMSPRRTTRIVHELARFAAGCVRQTLARRELTVYLALSGGLRQVLDMAFLAIASVCARPKVFVHHHSFGYLNEPTTLARIVLWMTRQHVHLVLCESMGRLLRDTFSVCQTVVVSNAAFVDIQDGPRSVISSNDQLTIGFISNITEEKGIIDFLELADHLNRNGVRVRSLVAGPLSGRIADVFHTTIERIPNAHYLGPVYGRDKLAFYQAIDVLVFPTKYKNEAEPVVIIEALSHSVPVVSRDRGCITCLVDGSCGITVASDDEFLNSAQEYIKSLLNGAIDYSVASRGARTRFELLRHQSLAAVQATLLSLGTSDGG
jgi:glycosyltransferase involved in cell wall biosynthesis